MSNVRTQGERTSKASRQRREQERENLRQLILDEASKLLLEQGYAQFSMRQLAERIGYTAPTIYHYFKDRDALIFAVVDEGWANFTALMAAAVGSSDDAMAQIIALGRAYIKFGLDNPTYYQLMFMQRPAEYLLSSAPDKEEVRIAIFDGPLRIVQAGIEAGRFKPGDATAYADSLWAMVHGMVALAITMCEMMTPERTQRAIEAAFEMSMNGLLLQATPAPDVGRGQT